MSSISCHAWSQELSQATAWWKKQLSVSSKGKLSQDSLSNFENSLASLLDERLQGHWFVENPIRGQAHRSLSLHRHARPDPVLLKAAATANIRNLFDFLSDDVNDITMFIDPCEVAVQIMYTFCKTPQESIIWTSPSKLNMRKPAMEPSPPLRIKAKNDFSSSSASSSPSLSPKSSPLRRSTNGDSSPRQLTALKASSREYSPSQSPARQPSPPPSPMFTHSMPYFVPSVPHFFPHYAPQFASNFEQQLSEFVRS